MYLDAFTISALVDEFLDVLVGGRIQDVIDVDESGIGLEIYANRKRHYLYLSADNTRPRVHLVGDKLRRGLQRPTQLGLVMRRFVEGGVVTHVSQPDWERILIIDVQGEQGDVEIIIEPMERRANVLLIQNGKIIDCLRRVGPDDNRYRLSLPAHEYVPPPPQTNKHNPFTVTLDDMVGFFEQTTDGKRKSFQVLSGNLLGFSPLLAKEIVFRSEGNIKQKAIDADPDSLFDVMQKMLEPLKQREWNTGIVDSDGLVEAYSVYPIEYLSGWKPIDTVSEAMTSFYSAPVGEDAYNNAKKPVQKAIEEAKLKLGAKLTSLESSLKDDSEREQLRQSGELILAYQYSLEDGQTELKAQYDMDAPELIISLDPKLSPLDNAQRYFSKYNKAKRALDDVPTLVQETKNELVFVEQLEMDLEIASNWPDIDDVRQALQAKGHWQGKPAKRIGGSGQSAPTRVVTPDGYVIWIGRNSRQNEIVTFKKSNSEDFWLHARQVAGAHVIIKNDGRRIPDDVIEEAASIAAYYSKRRNDGKVPVDVIGSSMSKRSRGLGKAWSLIVTSVP